MGGGGVNENLIFKKKNILKLPFLYGFFGD